MLNIDKKLKSIFKESKKPFKNLFSDFDGDKVLNFVDCKVFNKARHGIRPNILMRQRLKKLPIYLTKGKRDLYSEGYKKQYVPKRSDLLFYRRKEPLGYKRLRSKLFQAHKQTGKEILPFEPDELYHFDPKKEQYYKYVVGRDEGYEHILGKGKEFKKPRQAFFKAIKKYPSIVGDIERIQKTEKLRPTEIYISPVGFGGRTLAYSYPRFRGDYYDYPEERSIIGIGLKPSKTPFPMKEDLSKAEKRRLKDELKTRKVAHEVFHEIAHQKEAEKEGLERYGKKQKENYKKLWYERPAEQFAERYATKKVKERVGRPREIEAEKAYGAAVRKKSLEGMEFGVPTIGLEEEYKEVIKAREEEDILQPIREKEKIEYAFQQMFKDEDGDGIIAAADYNDSVIEEDEEGKNSGVPWYARTKIPHWLFDRLSKKQKKKAVKLFKEGYNEREVAEYFKIKWPYDVEKREPVFTTRQEKINILQQIGEEKGRAPLLMDLKEYLQYPTSGAFKRAFGSWAVALRAAGFEPRASSFPLRTVEERVKDIGKIPSFKEVREHTKGLPEFKERVQEYRQRPEVKERAREKSREQYKRPEVKKRVQEYRQQPEVKKRTRAAERLRYPKVKEEGRIWSWQTPEGKKWRKKWRKEYEAKHPEFVEKVRENKRLHKQAMLASRQEAGETVADIIQEETGLERPKYIKIAGKMAKTRLPKGIEEEHNRNYYEKKERAQFKKAIKRFSEQAEEKVAKEMYEDKDGDGIIAAADANENNIEEDKVSEDKYIVGGYTYYDNKKEASKQVKSSDDVVAFESGLGWYLHSKKEYKNNPRKRIFGF